MEERLQFYIDGRWVDPGERRDARRHQPGDRGAVRAHRLGGATTSTGRSRRRAGRSRPSRAPAARSASRCCERIVAAYQKRYDDLAQTISREMGAPMWLAKAAQAATGRRAPERRRSRCWRRTSSSEPQGHDDDPPRADRRVRLHHAVELAGEPDHLQGRAGAGRRLHDGAEAERDRAAQRDHLRRDHARSRRAGGRVQPGQRRRPDGRRRRCRRIPASTWCRSPARRAPASRSPRRPPTRVKRVAQELGGKSANIILDDADLESAVAGGVAGCFTNSGQSCNAPTRMLVPRRAARPRPSRSPSAAAESVKVGDPLARRHDASARWSARRSSTRSSA